MRPELALSVRPELGWWKCSYRSTRGERETIRLRGRSAQELVEQLAKLRPARRKKKPKKTKAPKVEALTPAATTHV